MSISGIAFSFDAEAYQVMKDYLDKLETGYAKKPDGREIVADIEARIAELILNEQESDNVVSRALAESVVAQLGFPDDLDTEEEPPVEKIPKRLYRNPDGAVLGGVCVRTGRLFPYRPRMDKARILPGRCCWSSFPRATLRPFSVRCSSCSSSCTSFSG